MYKVSDFVKPCYKTGEVAAILNVTTKTVQNYDKWHKLKVCRTEGNRRCVMKEDLLAFLSEKGLLVDDTETLKHDIIYLQVADGTDDGQEQLTKLLAQTKQINNPTVLIDKMDTDDVYFSLMDYLVDKRVNKLYVYASVAESEMFKYVQHICEHIGVELVTVE